MLNLNFTPFPRLTTNRLQLRGLKKKDAGEILILRSDERVNKFLDRPKAVTINDAKNFIEKILSAVKSNQSIYWAITLKDADTLIGTICMWNISLENNMAEMGYELHPGFQGKGLMQEAISAVTDYGFNKMDLQVITASTHPGNLKSIKLLLKNNFVPDENYEYADKEIAGNESAYYLIKPV
jgi:ribosomal-protein-alanine N-acetyltransferase